MPAKTASSRIRIVLAIAGILLVAANLRAPFTGIAPLLDMIRAAFTLDTLQTGVLTTLPLLAFAFASPFCALLARKFGLERSLFMALAIIGAGVLIRPIGSLWLLFAGSAIIGIGIAIANVLLPPLLKRDYPDHIAALTSAYALAAGIAAALVSAAVVPLATLDAFGWQGALAAFILLPLLAMAFWAPRLATGESEAQTPAPASGGRLWRSPLAWQVTLFFGLNSLVYYVVVTWLPAILIESGYSQAAAGSLHGVSQLGTALPGLMLAPMIRRLRDQRGMAVGTALILGFSLLGLIFAPSLAIVWTALFGFGSGAVFILALAFISLRVADARQAVTLSGMAQSIGYSLAAAAPPLFGLARDLSGTWSLPLALCAGLCVIMAMFGYLAGRARHI